MNESQPAFPSRDQASSPEITVPRGQEQVIRIIVDTNRSARSTWWPRVLMAAFIFSLMMNLALFSAYGTYFQATEGPQEQYHSGSKTARKKVAILSASATIMPPFTERIIETIQKAAEDEDVIGAVLVVDSPGGLVADSHQIYHELTLLARKKPLFVQMKRIAASGGYYIAMAAGEEGKVFAEPTTWTGSIGVIIPHYNLTEVAEKVGVRSEPLTTGEFKDSLSAFKPLSEREREVWSGIIDEAFQRFLGVIETGRPQLNRQQIEAVATGRVFTADQAVAEGLVDGIGYLDETIDKLREHLGVDEVRAVEYSHPPTLADLFLGSMQAPSEVTLLRQLFDSPSPQAFYLLGASDSSVISK